MTTEKINAAGMTYGYYAVRKCHKFCLVRRFFYLCEIPHGGVARGLESSLEQIDCLQAAHLMKQTPLMFLTHPLLQPQIDQMKKLTSNKQKRTQEDIPILFYFLTKGQKVLRAHQKVT